MAKTDATEPSPRKKAKTDASPRMEDHPLAKAVREALTCPITHQLVVCPVVAEDGNTYERDAIVTWLHEKKKMRSPITNAAMGDRLLDSRKARDLVAAAVHSGAVAEADAGAWHVSSARKMATGGLPGGLAGATEHLERAPKSRERELLLRAATLRADMAALVRDGNAADVIGVEAFLAGGFPLEGPKSAPSCDGLPLRAWRPDLVGRVVRVISDESELEELCDRCAPGADEEVGWNEDMAEMCGESFEIEEAFDDSCSYKLRLEPDTYMVPFDACILVREGADAAARG